MTSPLQEKTPFEKFKIFSKNFLTSMISIKEVSDKTSGAPEEQINALSQQSTVSQLMFYKYAEELTLANGEIKTLYTMNDGSKGIILEVTPPVFLGDDNERDMHNFFNSFYTDNSANAIVHINTYASRNIDNYIDAFKEVHNVDESVIVKRRDILKELIEKRADSYKNWSSNSIGRNGARIRNFVNTISILFPSQTPEEEIMDVYVNVENILVNYNARDMKPDKLIATISEFVKPEDLISETFVDEHQVMNAQMCTGARIKLHENNGTFKLGESWTAATLTTEKFPKRLSIFEFQSAFFDPFGKDFKMPIASPFMCSLVIDFSDAEKNAKKTSKKAQHNIGQIHFAPDKLEKQRPNIKHKREENENIVRYIEEFNEYPLNAMWSLTILDNNETSLKSSISLIKKKFKEISQEGNGWILKEESYSPIAFQTFLMSHPLQYSKIVRDNLKRFRVLFKSNNSQIAPLISGNKGFGAPNLMMPDRTGQVMAVDFFESTKNYNVIIIGPPGSGKSFFVNEIGLMSVAASQAVRLVDIGSSYKKIIKSVGGQFIQFEEGRRLCLNFFTNIATKKVRLDDDSDKLHEIVHEEELTTIVPIIGNMLKMDLKSSHSEASLSEDDLKRKAIVTLIEEAIQVAFDRQQYAAGMQTVWDYLVELKDKYKNDDQELIYKTLELIIVGLHDYVKRDEGEGKIHIGKNFDYFNGVNNLEFESDYFCFEMEELMKKGEDLLEIVSMVVLHQMANEAFFRQDKRKVIGVDEAAILLKKPMFVSFLEELSRRLRKYGGLLMIITQYIKDFFLNSSAEVMFEGASFKIFLPQEPESIDEAADTGKLTMNAGQIALMKSVAPRDGYNEFLIKYGSSYTVGLLKVDSLSYWLYTTKPSDKEQILNMENTYGLLIGEGAWMMSLTSDGMSEEDALEHVLTRRSKSLDD